MHIPAPETSRHPPLDPDAVKLLLVEAAPASRRLLAELLRQDPRMCLLADVATPEEAADFLQHRHADVVLMDHDGPRGAGLEGIRRIMETHPVPIVLCTAADTADEGVFRSLAAGAVACVDKPQAGGDAAAQAQRARHMRLTLKLMAEVKVVRHWKRPPAAGARGSGAPARDWAGTGGVKIIGIGASTGGPPVLQAILAGLPADLCAPVLVVQHIAPGFLPSMVQWLRQTSGLQVEIAAHGVLPRPGHVYLAPDDCQMGMGSAGRIVVSRGDGATGLRPSVAFLFRSLAEVYGPQAIGVLLSGMGRDGAEELKRMHERGATTIAQDSETSVVHGMPGEAIALGGVTHVLPAHRIAGALLALVRGHHREGS